LKGLILQLNSLFLAQLAGQPAELFIYSEQKLSVCRSVCDIKWCYKL